ncbi:Exostosin-like protein [Corchorus capsularis]|uniref:Exostosin-like protein n=1 Tax=Corchorus capsularis TaxID=210143 RepID=A0A1R3KDP0_COCAP|nr:Exostosin-like protein [Corchorus capsularis]
MGKPSSFLLYKISEHRFPAAFKGFFYFLPISLALTTLLLIFIYITTTAYYVTNSHAQTTLYLETLPTISSSNYSLDHTVTTFPFDQTVENDDLVADPSSLATLARTSKWLGNLFGLTNGNYTNNQEAYHDRDLFLEDYKQMNKSLKIFVYPHPKDDPFANVLLPTDYEPTGNYASELYFKKSLMKSHFVTKDPNEADLFYMPFSMSTMRTDPRIDVEGIPDFVKNYILNISHKYPYWNRTGGADHFYVACHSIGKTAFDKSFVARLNVIQLVCSSTYFPTYYFPHKDASMPQVWPRIGEPTNLLTSKRKRLAFFAGAVNSPVRIALLKAWANDTEIFAHSGRLQTPYSEQLLGSKFCIHVKGFEVNTARVADSLYYGCVPIILANHYDLPFTDIVNWRSFSVVVHHRDIPVLKNILQRISIAEYEMLQSNVIKVRKHFQWHPSPIDFDAFHMSMYELWKRRSVVRVRLTPSVEFM